MCDHFDELPETQNKCITTPEAKAKKITTWYLERLHEGNFKSEVLKLLKKVIEDDARMVIEHNGKPIAVLSPIVDYQMLVAFQHELDPCMWVELVNDARENLGLQPITGDQENDSTGVQEDTP